MPNKTKRASAAKKPNKAATVIKVILLILAVVVILAAAVFGAYYLSNGFGGKYATFATTINGKLILASGNVDLPRGSEIKIVSFSDYSFKVTAAEPEEDIELTIGGQPCLYSELAGEDMTAGFTFTESDGVITVDYGSLSEILSSALGEDVAAAEGSENALFTLTVESGKSTLDLNFLLGQSWAESITLDPGHIIV